MKKCKLGFLVALFVCIGLSIPTVSAASIDMLSLTNTNQVSLLAINESGVEETPWGGDEETSTPDNNNTYKKVTCGEMEIPALAPKIVSTLLNVLQIATPILIIFFGSLDLIKAVMAQKEDDIKKGQQTFIKRLLVGCIVFLAFWVVEIIIGLVAPHNENKNMWDCVDCFITGDCENL